MDELKPCPFCPDGGEPEMIVAPKFKQKPLWPTGAEQPDEYNCWVRCKKCYTVCGAENYPTEAEAAAAWNRRATLENKELTCEGCIHHNSDVPWPEICFECKRQSRQDMYRRKPEGSKKS